MQRLAKFIPILMYVMVFLMPLAQKLLPVLIVLTALSVIFEKGALPNFSTAIKEKSFWINSGIFWLYLIGMSYTENQNNGWKEIETKLSLLLFPMLFAASAQLKNLKHEAIFKALFWGCFLNISFLLWRSIGLFGYEIYARENLIILELYPFTNLFFGAYLSPFLHTGYFALFINLALGFIINQYVIKKDSAYSGYLIPAGLLLIALFLLQSKIGIITFMITVAAALWRKYGSENKKKLMLKLALALSAVVLLLMFIFPNTGKGFFKAIETLKNADQATLNSYDGSASRVAAWLAGSKVAGENLLTGTGTGDARPAIIEKQKEMGFHKAAEHDLNAHNQFLQTTVALGVAGFLMLIFFIAFQLRTSGANHNFIHLIFIVSITLQFLIEVSLDTQAGVIFIAFFANFFTFSSEKN